MKLYLVHCGFYDKDLCDGLYESHVNFFVAAESFEEARAKAKLRTDFQNKHMHVDGLQEVVAVDGMKINLSVDEKLLGETIVINNKRRDLAPKTASNGGESNPSP